MAARIPIYGAKDFLQFIDTSPAVLGVFVAPWCAHSKRLAGDLADPANAGMFAAPGKPKEEGGRGGSRRRR